MSSQVFYRKWRPRTFAELVGQELVTRTLLNALAQERVAHAYLFSGPRGTGKTSTGRLLAKAVNCLTNGHGEPCDICPMCQAISEGRAMDLIEIDAASNRGIDDIRRLRESVNYAPGEARYKVYIIDEVHQLTSEAFNALLKTLEEPPPHAIFVLATTAPHQIPATIASRCQRFDFRRLRLPAMLQRLEQVCQGEAIAAEAEVLETIARAASGSLRDAENLLEQLVVYYGPSLQLAVVQEHMGLTPDERVLGLIRCIMHRDMKGGISLLIQAAEDGVDPQQFRRQLLEHLRGMLLIKADGRAALDLPAEALAEARLLSADAAMEDIVWALRAFGEADLRLAGPPLLPLEMALVECCLPEADIEPVPQVSTPPPSQRIPLPSQATASPSRPPVSAAPQRRQSPAVAEVQGVNHPSVSGDGQVAAQGSKPRSDTEAYQYLLTNWRRVQDACRGVNKTAEALLRSSCRPVAVEDNTVILGFKYEILKEKLEQPQNRRDAEEVLSKVLGAPHLLRCIIVSEEESRSSARESPLVKAATEMGARIIKDEQEEMP